MVMLATTIPPERRDGHGNHDIDPRLVEVSTGSSAMSVVAVVIMAGRAVSSRPSPPPHGGHIRGVLS